LQGDPSPLLEAFELSESDRPEFAREETMQIIRESRPEHSALGVGGWPTTSRTCGRGASISTAYRSPVLIWCGCTDVLVPPAHEANRAPGLRRNRRVVDSHTAQA
jgi:hypothetical protein